MYFGLPSPACAPVVGELMGSTRLRVDRYGSALTTARLPGDGWRLQHDALKWRIHHDCREQHARMEVEVYGLFAACIPQAGRRRLSQEPLRKRQGLVPDFLLHAGIDGPERPLLLELKMLHHGSSTYPASARRCEATARRARQLPTEYAAKATRVDRQFCETSAGEVGPVARRLQRFDAVRGLVVGAWAECSPDVERLLGWLAKVGAERQWRSMGCQDEAGARGIIAWALRRRWALTAMREHARLKLSRLQFVGPGAGRAALRRSNAQAAWAARSNAQAWEAASARTMWW